MTHPAVRVENLGKQYQLGLREQGYRTFRETIMDAAAAPLRRFRHLSGTSRDAEKIWALKDVSFDVEPGEVIGIIGPNGAGKTTLLKILTRITEPTTGRAEVRGHVGSLLEVGTGFHPELTGRENVFLNGAVLGMSRATVKRRFDEIVDFSGVERFLDTPVKRYSTGMRVRLAFAVAAHLDPEILLVDEVLAVGDIGFQQKCLGKMRDVAGHGRTVLFVSHNMGAIEALCSRVIVLEEGNIGFEGPTREGVAEHTRRSLAGREKDKPIQVIRQNFETGSAQRITDLELLNERSESLSAVTTGDYVCFRLHFAVDELIPNPGFRLRIFSEDRNELFRVSTDPISGYHVPPLQPCQGHIDCILPQFPFTAGTYFVDVGITLANTAFVHDVENAAVLEIQGRDVYGSGMHLTTKAGYFVCDHQWHFGPPR